MIARIGTKELQRVAALLLLFVFASTGTADVSSEMKFLRNGDTVYAMGVIDESAASRLQEFAKANDLPAGTVIALSSPGGSLIGGLKLGQMIRTLQFGTNVFRYAGLATHARADGAGEPITTSKTEPADCASACIYAYVGGIRRLLHADSRLGIHQFYFSGSDGGATDAQVLSAAIVAHLSNMGVDPTLFSATALFGKDDLRFLSRQEAEDFGLVNNGARQKIRYQASRGRPYPELVQESADGIFRLGLLCNGTHLYIGASRQQKQRSAFYDENEKVFFWMDDRQVFEMDGRKDSFHAIWDRDTLRTLLASRRIRIWAPADGWPWDGARMVVADWSHFAEYSAECGA
jgi:hypothetical protein